MNTQGKNNLRARLIRWSKDKTNAEAAANLNTPISTFKDWLYGIGSGRLPGLLKAYLDLSDELDKTRAKLRRMSQK